MVCSRITGNASNVCPKRMITLLFLFLVVLVQLYRPSALEGSKILSSSKTRPGSQTISGFAYDPEFHPVWNCSDPHALEGRDTKVIFVHVFKTAGSTMRSILAAYSYKCHAGFSILAGCSNLDAALVNSTIEPWVDKVGNPCRQKMALNRDRESIVGRSRKISNALLKDIDLVAGHLPIGIHEYWLEPVTPMYITFFREPVAKFVSGVIYTKRGNEDLTVDDIAEIIKIKVTNEVENGGYRQGYSNYLLTPFQKELNVSSVANRVEMIKANLVKLPVVIGIVEKMIESMELIGYVLDGNREYQDQFESSAKLRDNAGVISTSKVIEKLREDEYFFEKLIEFVKYDRVLYDFALELHERQYQALQSKL